MGNRLVKLRAKKKSRQQMRIDDDQGLLSRMIEPCNGLLDELYESEVLNTQQIELLRNRRTVQDAVRKLLTEVNKMSGEKQVQFLTALDKTGQSHVSNYICNNGRRPATDSDDWPIIACTGHYKRIERNWEKVQDSMDPNNGLLEELLSVCYITSRQKWRIADLPGDAAKNHELLCISRQKSVKDHKKFIDCLTKTKQYHVVSLLQPDTSTIVQPVSEEHINILITNYSTLVELIDLNTSVLLAKLLSDGVITRRQKEYIESATTQSESNSRLLDIVKRGSDLNYLKFIDCLENVGQSHVASVLTDGVVAEMVAQTSLSRADEDHIVELFNKLCTNVSPDRKEPLRCRLAEIMSETLQDNRLIAMKTNHSIKLFFHCTSLKGLLFLDEMRTTDRLRPVIEQILATLLQQERSLTVFSLKWKTSDYNKCVQYLSSVSGLTVYSKLHRLAKQSQHVATDTDYASNIFTINRLPYELLELVLLKAEGQLFVTLKKLVSCAHSATMTTLHSVCLYWWKALTSRQKYRQLLIKYCNQQCAPYKFNPKLATSIGFKNCAEYKFDSKLTAIIRLKNRVSGVAELCSKLFIIDGNTLRVISIVGSNYCDLGERITMSQSRNLEDIVACRVTNCLYVSDSDTRCIWRVSSSSLFQDAAKVALTKFIVTDYQPSALSVQSSRLVVTPQDGTEVSVYSCDDGELKKKIERPHYTGVLHAVETLDTAVVVCEINLFTEDEMNPDYAPSVREKSQDGQVLRSYKGPALFTLPFYMTTDSKNRFLVCDYENKSIVHLNRELELEHIALSDELRGQPFRACYSEDRGRLYVCYWDDNTVDVYRI